MINFVQWAEFHDFGTLKEVCKSFYPGTCPRAFLERFQLMNAAKIGTHNPITSTKLTILRTLLLLQDVFFCKMCFFSNLWILLIGISETELLQTSLPQKFFRAR